MTSSVVDRKFREWTQGKEALAARVAVFERIRDIPYAIVPEISDAQTYAEIFSLGEGSCTPKHLLLCDMYQRLGLPVLYAVYPFRWDEVELDYPPRLLKLARELPISHHLACLVEIEGSLRLVDATLDLPLAAMGLSVNEHWDGFSDTKLAITPSGEQEIHHPSEALFMTSERDDKSLEFGRALNRWLTAFREPEGTGHT
jgi:hypothetical protein